MRLRLTILVIAVFLIAAEVCFAQKVYRFSVKVGIDCESVDSLGGEKLVRGKIADMFGKINKAFNHTRQFDAVYDFAVDWDAFYIYDGISTEEVFKPHPEHDYLVIIDGYKSNPKEQGGGWYGSDIQTVYHARTHNDRFNDPFNSQAIDGIIHEFGHGRGVPDIYAMKVEACNNPVAPVACYGTRCIMDYPYGETKWSDYAVNMINLSGDKMVEIDNLVAEMRPDMFFFNVLNPDGKPAVNASLNFYPVEWYSNKVSPKIIYTAKTDSDGKCYINGDNLFPKCPDYGLKYSNIFVEAEADGLKSYAWLPLYEIENVKFNGEDTYRLEINLKSDKPSGPLKFSVADNIYHAPENDGTDRWSINKSGQIEWSVKKTQLPHSDHIEMTGEQVSVVLRWDIDDDGTLHTERSLIFPMLRTLPNDTHASLMQRIGVDIPSMISVDGLSLKNGKTGKIIIDGYFKSEELWSVGKKNTGSGRGIAPVPAVELERTVFPSVDKPVVCERYILTNIRDREMTVYVPEFTQRYHTLESKGKDGIYIVETSIEGQGTYKLKKGESVTFDLLLSGRKASDSPVRTDVSSEFAAREVFVREDIGESLVLETPDEVINTMFRYSKIRTSESICKTAGGYMHAPGGESYYAAIWANDQAEYVNPFFPYLGYWRGNESAVNSFLHFARYMNEDFTPLPSSIIAEGTDIWNGAGDRGDAAMIAYGASRFALEYADMEVAKKLWPLVEWCLEYCSRKLNDSGVVESDTDELEGRFEDGDANLCTSALYYDALISASYLSKELGYPVSKSALYRKRANVLKQNIEKYFGSEVGGFHTYRYYDGNTLLRSWICIPLTVGIFDRAEETVAALCSPRLWQKDGLLTEEGSVTFWDRSTLYALRGIFAAGKPDLAFEKLHSYSTRRLLGNHVPYAIEAWPEGSQRHLAAESGLYCRVITEGIFGIRPTGFRSFELKPSLPSCWNSVSLKKIKAFGCDFDIEIVRTGASLLKVSVSSGEKVRTYNVKVGNTLKINF